MIPPAYSSSEIAANSTVLRRLGRVFLSGIFLLFSAALHAHSPDPAGDQLPEGASLNDLLRYAAENSPEMRAAFEEWRAAVERAPQARALPDPELTYGYFVQRMETRQLVSLSQTFPAFGKRGLRGEMAELEAEAAEKRFEAARLDVFARVKTAYSEYAYIIEGTEVLRRLHDISRQFHEVAMARFRSGEVGAADALRAEMEIGRIGDELFTMEGMIEPAAAILNAALGRREKTPLPVLPLEHASTLEESVALDLENRIVFNPELRAREREVVRAETAMELARREGWPDVMVGIEYMENRGMNRDEVMVMAGITLPIWREKYAAARREARADRNAAAARRDSQARDLEADLRMAFFRVRDAERRARLHGDILQPLARQSHDSLMAAYRAGDANFLELIDAQQMLLDHELMHLRAKADHLQYLAELERLTGGGQP